MPKPYDDRLALTVEEGGLLCCMRVWVVGAQSGGDAEWRIRELMARLDAPEAAPYLEGFMFALQHGAARTIAVDCVCRPSISEDERALLDAIGLVQESRLFEALLLLRGLLTPEGARAALGSAEGIAAALARVGRFLPAPEAEVRRFALAVGSPAAARPSSATLH